MSSTFTGSLVGGSWTFSPCSYLGAVWLALPRLRFGHKSSAARAHSSTSSNDFVRRFRADSFAPFSESFSSSSSTSIRAFSLPVESAFAPHLESSSLAQSRIMEGVRFLSRPSACRSSMCFSFFCIHFAGRCALSTALNAAAAPPAGDVNWQGGPVREKSSEVTNSASMAARFTLSELSVQTKEWSSSRNGSATFPWGPLVQISASLGMSMSTMKSSPLQSWMPQCS
mmetsp:Transcript_37486/g.107100  ORF Transcript_37486/g.107100 Transcript_37486/m.107100 type:complete len:227 (+) Transcript_37486:648-1328(+)